MPTRLTRLAGAALLLGGWVNVLFLVAAAGHVVGAAFMRTGQFALAHQAHFYAAILLLVGLVGLHSRQASRAGTLGATAFLIALIGTGMYVGTGMATGFLLPVVAVHAPHMLEATGAFFDPPIAIVPATVLFFGVGWVLTGVATSRAALVPRWTGLLLAAGALLQGLPPAPFGPFPWMVLTTGGVLMAIATTVIGYRMMIAPAADGAAAWVLGRTA